MYVYIKETLSQILREKYTHHFFFPFDQGRDEVRWVFPVECGEVCEAEPCPAVYRWRCVLIFFSCGEVYEATLPGRLQVTMCCSVCVYICVHAHTHTCARARACVHTHTHTYTHTHTHTHTHVTTHVRFHTPKPTWDLTGQSASTMCVCKYDTHTPTNNTYIYT